MSSSGRRASLGLGLLGGVAHSCVMLGAFGALGVGWLWWLSLLSVTPLVVAGLRAGDRRVWVAAGAGLGSLLFWGWTHRWIAGVSLAGLPALLVYLSLYPSAFVWWVARVGRPGRVAVWGGLCWAGLEVLRGEVVWAGYAWFAVGHPAIEWAWAARPASVGGAYLVTLLVAVLSVAIGVGLSFGVSGRGDVRSARRTATVAGLVAVMLWAGLSLVSAPRFGDEQLTIAAVQTNVPTSVRRGWLLERRLADFERFIELTGDADLMDPLPDLIVWPETMFPGETLDPESLAVERAAGLQWAVDLGEGVTPLPSTAFADALCRVQSALGTPMLVGAKTHEALRIEAVESGGVRFEAEWTYNAAVLVRRGAPQPGWYAKMHLTPFGEVMPGISRFDGLERALLSFGAAGMSFDLDVSEEARVIELAAAVGPSVPIGTPICFESSKAWVCRGLVIGGERGGRRARVLVNMTNDGWFGGADDGRWWHVMMGRWRCVELGTPMVRAANTGVSCAIDASGRVTSGPSTGGPAPGSDGVLLAPVRLAEPDHLTPYARGGWRSTWAILALGALASVMALIGGRGTNQPKDADERALDSSSDPGRDHGRDQDEAEAT
ncbi:MAG: apolipoprotein N-acyltransferase [Planctomycetota bacterium]